MLTRWLMIGLLVSVGLLLLAAGLGAGYIWRRRKMPGVAGRKGDE